MVWHIASQSVRFILNSSGSLQSENRKKTSQSCHTVKSKLAVTDQIQPVSQVFEDRVESILSQLTGGTKHLRRVQKNNQEVGMGIP